MEVVFGYLHGSGLIEKWPSSPGNGAQPVSVVTPACGIGRPLRLSITVPVNRGKGRSATVRVTGLVRGANFCLNVAKCGALATTWYVPDGSDNLTGRARSGFESGTRHMRFSAGSTTRRARTSP